MIPFCNQLPTDKIHGEAGREGGKGQPGEVLLNARRDMFKVSAKKGDKMERDDTVPCLMTTPRLIFQFQLWLYDRCPPPSPAPPASSAPPHIPLLSPWYPKALRSPPRIPPAPRITFPSLSERQPLPPHPLLPLAPSPNLPSTLAAPKPIIPLPEAPSPCAPSPPLSQGRALEELGEQGVHAELPPTLGCSLPTGPAPKATDPILCASSIATHSNRERLHFYLKIQDVVASFSRGPFGKWRFSVGHFISDHSEGPPVTSRPIGGFAVAQGAKHFRGHIVRSARGHLGIQLEKKGIG